MTSLITSSILVQADVRLINRPRDSCFGGSAKAFGRFSASAYTDEPKPREPAGESVGKLLKKGLGTFGNGVGIAADDGTGAVDWNRCRQRRVPLVGSGGCRRCSARSGEHEPVAGTSAGRRRSTCIQRPAAGHWLPPPPPVGDVTDSWRRPCTGPPPPAPVTCPAALPPGRPRLPSLHVLATPRPSRRAGPRRSIPGHRRAAAATDAE